MEIIRYNEVCKLLASFIIFPMSDVPVDNVLYHVVRRLTVCNDDMRDKVKDYARDYIVLQKYNAESIDVEETLSRAMHVYDTIFFEGNPCA